MKYPVKVILDSIDESIARDLKAIAAIKDRFQKDNDPEELKATVIKDHEKYVRAYEAMLNDNNTETRRDLADTAGRLYYSVGHLRDVDRSYFRQGDEQSMKRDIGIIDLRITHASSIRAVLASATDELVSTTELERIGYYKFARS